MALMKSASVPDNAVKLTELEAMSYVWDVVWKWDKLSDVWALRYAPAVLGGLSSISGVLVNKFFRQKLKLGVYGQMSSLIPIAVMPGVFSALFHRHVVATDLLLMRNTCPLCYELRAAAIQVGFGILYPIVLAPWTSLMLANRYNTARTPSLVKEPKELLKFTIKMSRPIYGSMIYYFGIHIAASSIVTYYEIKNNITLRRKLLEIENKLESENS